MTVYICSQSYRLFDPDHNCRSLVAGIRSRQYAKGDVLVLPAQFMNGMIEEARAVRDAHWEKMQGALNRLMSGLKRSGISVILPVRRMDGYDVYKIVDGVAEVLPFESFEGGFTVRQPLDSEPYDLIFRTACVGEAFKPDLPSSYVLIDGQAFTDDGRVYIGQCKVVRNGRTRSTHLASDKIISLDEGGAALLSDHHIRYEGMRVALREYLNRCGFSKVTIGLSGGLDSAVVASVAVSVLGSDRVNVFALPSCYTSEASFKDARELCANLGLHLRMIDIMPAFKLLESTVNDQLPYGLDTGLMKENLQARIRGVYLMALSNADGSLVLNTGNKSELAVGYCTLYGDMVGGLALLSDVYKSDLYAMCETVDFLREMIPSNILTKAPSAELRDNQTDQDSLPSYDVLDAILHQMIEERIDGAKLRKRWGSDLAQQVVRLVKRSQFKHRLAPLGVRLSEEPLKGLSSVFFEGLLVDRR